MVSPHGKLPRGILTRPIWFCRFTELGRFGLKEEIQYRHDHRGQDCSQCTSTDLKALCRMQIPQHHLLLDHRGLSLLRLDSPQSCAPALSLLQQVPLIQSPLGCERGAATAHWSPGSGEGQFWRAGVRNGAGVAQRKAGVWHRPGLSAYPHSESLQSKNSPLPSSANMAVDFGKVASKIFSTVASWSCPSGFSVLMFYLPCCKQPRICGWAHSSEENTKMKWILTWHHQDVMHKDFSGHGMTFCPGSLGAWKSLVGSEWPLNLWRNPWL